MEQGPKFDKSGRCFLRDIHGDTVLLNKKVWERKLKMDNRHFFQFNFEKIRETLRSPDKTRKSKNNDWSKLYYKKYDRIWLSEGVTAPFLNNYFVVIVGNRNGIKFVQTFYPTNRIKE